MPKNEKIFPRIPKLKVEVWPTLGTLQESICQKPEDCCGILLKPAKERRQRDFVFWVLLLFKALAAQTPYNNEGTLFLGVTLYPKP